MKISRKQLRHLIKEELGHLGMSRQVREIQDFLDTQFPHLEIEKGRGFIKIVAKEGENFLNPHDVLDAIESKNVAQGLGWEAKHLTAGDEELSTEWELSAYEA